MKLREVTELIVDSEHKTAPKQDTGYPYIRTPNIGEGRLILDDVQRISEESYKEWTRRAIPQKNDLILAREAPVGNVAIVTDGIKPCLGQRTVLIRPDSQKIDPEYLVYLMLGDEIQERFYAVSTGATVPHLNMSDIRGLELPELPSLETQQKIASTLSAFDDLIENNTRRIEILEEMALRIYREWFVHFRYPGHENDELVDSGTELGEIPEGWEVKKLEDLCELTLGQSPKSEFYNEKGEGLPFHQGVKDFEDRYPTTTTWCSKIKRIAEEGDILFSVRAPVGRINIANTKMIIGRGLHSIRSKYANQVFIFHQLKDKFQEEDVMGSGTIYKSVTKKDMLNLKLIDPGKEMIEEFEDKVVPLFKQFKILTNKNEKLKETRDLLLPKLISGEIEVESVPLVK